MRAQPSTPTRMFCGEHVAVHEAERAGRRASVSSCAAWRPGERVEHDAQRAPARGSARAAAQRARR